MKKIIIFLAVILAGNFFFLKKLKSPDKEQSENGIVSTISNAINDTLGSNERPVEKKSSPKKTMKSAIVVDNFFEVAIEDFKLLIEEKSKIRNKTEEMIRELKQYKENRTKNHISKKNLIQNYNKDIECITGPGFRSCRISSEHLLLKNGYPDHTGSEKSRNEQAKFLKDEINDIQAQIKSDLEFITTKQNDIKKNEQSFQEFNSSLSKWKTDLQSHKNDKRAIIGLHLKWIEAAMKISTSSQLAITLLKKTCSIEPGLYGCDNNSRPSDDQIWQFVDLN